MENLKEILKQNGIQVTQQRLDVLRVLKELNTHVTVDDVLAALKERNINLTVATAYNILNTFEKKNIIMKVNTAGEPVIYDVNTYDHIHVCDYAASVYGFGVFPGIPLFPRMSSYCDAAGRISFYPEFPFPQADKPRVGHTGSSCGCGSSFYPSLQRRMVGKI